MKTKKNHENLLSLHWLSRFTNVWHIQKKTILTARGIKHCKSTFCMRRVTTWQPPMFSVKRHDWQLRLDRLVECMYLQDLDTVAPLYDHFCTDSKWRPMCKMVALISRLILHHTRKASSQTSSFSKKSEACAAPTSFFANFLFFSYGTSGQKQLWNPNIGLKDTKMLRL